MEAWYAFWNEYGGIFVVLNSLFAKYESKYIDFYNFYAKCVTNKK